MLKSFPSDRDQAHFHNWKYNNRTKGATVATQFIGKCEGNFCSGDVDYTLMGFC